MGLQNSHILLIDSSMRIGCVVFDQIKFFELTILQWNSTSWDEFSRKWNKPVHSFLLRHVYAPLIYSCGFSKTIAMLITFFLSASAHELVMVVVTQKIRLYLFIMQLVQVFLILLSRHPIIKRNKLMGNVVFWLGLYAGFPLLCVAYVAY
ncbi:Sterol O-acyltransferase 2 (Sterol-ester synthase 2) [Leucoagaricus gongylophorus]